jgi:transposase-like protein
VNRGYPPALDTRVVDGKSLVQALRSYFKCVYDLLDLQSSFNATLNVLQTNAVTFASPSLPAGPRSLETDPTRGAEAGAIPLYP